MTVFVFPVLRELWVIPTLVAVSCCVDHVETLSLSWLLRWRVFQLHEHVLDRIPELDRRCCTRHVVRVDSWELMSKVLDEKLLDRLLAHIRVSVCWCGWTFPRCRRDDVPAMYSGGSRVGH